ncbi:C39 family peptidase [Candidatus Leptofilum sp.]|uniref:C39 family peptidase n=1 Tax=Candidatus Leptofilum sp. TaxID=3241576 RepID=UPI003B590F70
MPQLEIPYRSQWDNDAKFNNSDCGPTCTAMLLNYFGKTATPDGIYDHLPSKDPNDFTFVWELVNVFKAHQVTATNIQYDTKATAFYHLRANIDAGKPMIALVKYQPWISATGNSYKWGHFVVISGYTDTHVLMHDPLFGMWAARSKGAFFALPNDLFAAGWGGFTNNENPNWVVIIAGDGQRTAATESAPAPTPAPVTPPKPTTPTTPVAPTTLTAPTEPVADEERRMWALAAYRWTEPPETEAEKQLWRTHLGDFAETYTTHTVQSGNTLVGLAARFYGEQHRWPTIKTFNDLKREGLMLGEKLLIPNLGQSGAGTNPALPSDTIDQAKALSLDELVNPDLPALDYNELGKNSVGIGFAEDEGS